MVAVIILSLIVAETVHSLGTTPNLQEVFNGRCYDYEITRYKDLLPRETTSCDELWALFFDAFAYLPPCNVSSSSYQRLYNEAKQDLPENKAMFWSGVYNFAHKYSNNAARYVTLEDTLMGYLANSLTWCGQEDAPGINFESCPSRSDCPLEASESFWSGASRKFASLAKGNVTVMLEGSNPNKAAYRKNSLFAKYEIPNIDVNSVQVMNVIVVHALGIPKLELCGTKSLLELEKDVINRGLRFVCHDNPASVMYLLCSEQPDSRECRFASDYCEGYI